MSHAQAAFNREVLQGTSYSSPSSSSMGVGLAGIPTLRVGLTGASEGVGRTGGLGEGRTEMVKERLGRGVRDGRLVSC
jgi:hypothetical protein